MANNETSNLETRVAETAAALGRIGVSSEDFGAIPAAVPSPKFRGSTSAFAAAHEVYRVDETGLILSVEKDADGAALAVGATFRPAGMAEELNALRELFEALGHLNARDFVRLVETCSGGLDVYRAYTAVDAIRRDGVARA